MDQVDTVSDDKYQEAKSMYLETAKTNLESTKETVADGICDVLDRIIATLEADDTIRLEEGKEYLDHYADATIAKEKYEEVVDFIQSLAKKRATDIETKIKKLDKNLNQADYEALIEQINLIAQDSYFDSYKEKWQNSLEKIEKKLAAKEVSDYKKSCKKLKYKNTLRNPDQYRGQRAYWFGKVLQVINDTDMRVGVGCKKFHYIKGYYCKYTIYVEYYGSESLIEDDMVKMWGVMNGNESYTTVLGSTVTIPLFEAKYIKRK